MLSSRLGRAAEADIDEQISYLSELAGPETARNWVLEVFAVIETLCHGPEIRRAVSSDNSAIRVLAHKRRFTLVYAVEADFLLFLRVHGRGQEVEELLG